MKLKNWQLALALGLGAAAVALKLSSCVSIPKGTKAVKPFYKDKYLGKWYEIARLDFKYEKNLNNVTATYTLRGDGLIRVDNRGYDFVNNKWKQSVGKAKFVGDPNTGRLQVSFFGPFYAGYNVIAIDDNYKYALIAGNNLNYLWILSREKTIPEAIKSDYLEKAKSIGYDVSKLVWDQHDR
ncbi:lipocalin family protein [Mucilaginibacter sp.]|uniref:lipocalin family protein n=1 Tax=Mucilaginibacter sp. TaxID=1882438 RepID=UPI0025F1D9E0|nr:lipocalin family protein [Mucilaginibacter sp.]